MKPLAIITLFCSAFVASTTPSFAAQGELDYPELMVTPSASQRIELESKDERGRRFSNVLPLMASSAVLFIGGILQSSNTDLSKDSDKYGAKVGAFVGGTWLTIGALMAFTYDPYQSALTQINRLPTGSKQEKLAKERYAEQELYRASKIGNILAITHLATTVGTSIYMMSNAQSGSLSKVYPAFSIAAAFLPIVFKTRWQQVASQHEEYKKKIYGPIASASATLFQNSTTGRWTPGLVASLHF